MTSGKHKTKKEIKKSVENLGYIFIDEYISKNKMRRVIVKDKHGYKYDVHLHHLFNNHSSIVGTTNKFSIYNISIWLKLNNKNFTICKDNLYKGSMLPIKFRCKTCREVFLCSWASVTQGHNCTNCNMSFGEQEVRVVLESMNVIFHAQNKFPKCVYKSSLRFDFYLPKYNLCIEYHGGQHYFPVDFGGLGKICAKKDFYEIRKRDKIKEKYCTKNNINLLIIPYWEKDMILNIIENEIKNLENK